MAGITTPSLRARSSFQCPTVHITSLNAFPVGGIDLPSGVGIGFVNVPVLRLRGVSGSRPLLDQRTLRGASKLPRTDLPKPRLRLISHFLRVAKGPLKVLRVCVDGQENSGGSVEIGPTIFPLTDDGVILIPSTGYPLDIGCSEISPRPADERPPVVGFHPCYIVVKLLH